MTRCVRPVRGRGCQQPGSVPRLVCVRSWSCLRWKVRRDPLGQLPAGVKRTQGLGTSHTPPGPPSLAGTEIPGAALRVASLTFGERRWLLPLSAGQKGLGQKQRHSQDEPRGQGHPLHGGVRHGHPPSPQVSSNRNRNQKWNRKARGLLRPHRELRRRRRARDKSPGASGSAAEG